MLSYHYDAATQALWVEEDGYVSRWDAAYEAQYHLSLAGFLGEGDGVAWGSRRDKVPKGAVKLDSMGHLRALIGD